MARLASLASDLLKQITDSFLNSSDFNGVLLDNVLKVERQAAIKALKTLIRKELVEIYSSEDDPNPHVKRLPAAPVTRQLEALTGTKTGEAVCLYPSTKHMTRVLPGTRYRSRPFTRLLALGHPQLEPIFFQLAVLERYQSDPRYVFRFNG